MANSTRKTEGGVLLIQPMTTALDMKKEKPSPPFGLFSAMRLLPEELSVRLLDQRLDKSFEQTLARELARKPLFVGVTAITGPMIQHALDVSRMAKELSPKTLIVWGGPHSLSAGSLAVAHPHVDVVVEGEGEQTLSEIATTLQNNGSLQDVRGLWLKKNGKAHHTGARDFLDMETLPPVSYRMAGQRYFYSSFGYPTAFMETSRGCPFRCLFCYQSMKKQKWRMTSPAWVLNAVRFLTEENPSVKNLYLTDDNYFHGNERTLEIAEGLLANTIDIHYQVQGARLDDLRRFSQTELELLARSGCLRVDIGAETGSVKLARDVGKPYDVAELIETVKNLSQTGIIPWVNFMAGFPDETSADLNQTLQVMSDLVGNVPDVMISPLYAYTPYPGTRLYERSVEKGFSPAGSIGDLAKSTWRKPKTPWLDAKQKKLLDRLYFFTIFIDDKITFYRNDPLTRLLMKLLQPVARLRLRKKWFFIPIEKWIFELVIRGEY